MASNEKSGDLHAAKPASGDLVDRFLEGKLRAALFGSTDQVQLGRLRIEGSLGRGATGAILSAFDPVLDRHVAIKGLLPDHSDDRDKLLREARLLAKLSHANVVSIYDVVEDNDGLYLVMEQVQGGDLRAWLARDRSWQEIVELFVQVGQGLAAAHALGIAHCDVKPDNVVVSDGRPRLIDFGLAHQRTDTPSHAGTPAYLAPERVAGGGGSAAADQYAFFASLVEAIEGRRSTDGARWERMPAWLEKVARRGLDPDPARRFGDMKAAVAALRRTPMLVKVLGAAVGLLLVGLIGVVLMLRSRSDAERRVCHGADDQLAGIWTPHTRAAMAAAFAATGVPDAPAIWSRVEQRLDRYTAAWVELRTQSCVATRVRGEQSVELLDYSMYCFDRQLLALASIARLFSEPNAAVVKGADKTIGELGELGELAGCVDPAALNQAVPLPEGADRKQQLRDLQARYEELKNFDRRGQYREALAVSDRLVGEARALGYAPLTVRVLVARGALQVTLHDLAAAEQTFREAASAAAQARDDKKVAEVWIRVIDLLAQQGRHDEALTLEPVAVTSAERVAADLEIQARLHNTLGGIYLAKARYKDAYAAYEKALAMQRRIGATGNPALTSAIANFGLAKWYAGDPRGAMSDLQAALTAMLADLGPDHSNVAYLRQNIADLHRQLGEADQATPHYQEVLRIWTSSLGAEHPNLAFPREQLALLASRRRDFAAAGAHIDEALRLREHALGPDHALVLQSLTVVAEIAIAEGTPASLARAEHAVTRAMAILGKLGEPGKRHAVYVLESRAQLAERRGDLTAALRDRQRVLEIRIETLGENHGDTANSFAQVGQTQLELGRTSEAEASLLRAQQIFDAHPGIRDGDAIAVIQGRAEVRMRRQHYRDAIGLLEQALGRAVKVDRDRAYEVRFALAKAHRAAGDATVAVDEARRLRAELSATGHEALVRTLDAWLVGR